MVYLSSKSIVHRALAAHSVMVGDTIDDIKLSRFGRSRDVYLSDEYVSTAPAALSNAVQHSEFVRWMSPEAIHDQAFSYASDVWSTAVVFSEIFPSGQSPPPSTAVRVLPRGHCWGCPPVQCHPEVTF